MEINVYRYLTMIKNLQNESTNHDFYHDWILFEKVKEETHKSYLIDMGEGVLIWIPKSIIKEFKNKRMFIHLNTFWKIMSSSTTTNKRR